MNFGCVIVNGVSNNVQIMKDFKRYAAGLHKNAFRCYNQIKGMRKEIKEKLPDVDKTTIWETYRFRMCRK